MNCDNCLPSCAINICSLSAVVIGTATPSTAYAVEIYDPSTEFTQSIGVTSNGSGVVTADLSDFKVTTNRAYQVRLYSASCMPIQFERDDVEANCFLFEFVNVTDLTPPSA